MENKNYHTIYRVMHWLLAFCIMFMLLTIFLRLTWMNKENMANIIQNYLNASNILLTRDEIITLAKLIRKPMWNWHIYTGYVLVGLFGLRLILASIGNMKFINPFQKELSLKVKFQYWIYLVFYACLATSLITGLLIELGPAYMKLKLESIHVLSLYYLIPFFILHLGGVILAEFTSQKGIISRIISGAK